MTTAAAAASAARLTRLPSLSVLSQRTHPFVRMVGWYSRQLLQRWCASAEVRGLDRLVAVLEDPERIARGQGILTYANHISVHDDPTLFGCLPTRMHRHSMTTRWTLGASDVLYTNSFNAYLFRNGQVLPTDRGRGVFQPALDHSIDLLQRAGWVHIFPEGYVNLSRMSRVRRFKWGIARLLMEAQHTSPQASMSAATVTPIILPIWLSGFDGIMPEPRDPPRWLPRPGARVTITFGEPINAELDPIIDRARHFANQSSPDEDQGSLSDQLATVMANQSTLQADYPVPAAHLLSTTTPLHTPPGGTPWPTPLPESRSYLATMQGWDTARARLARSFVAAELRAHLVRLGREVGGGTDQQLVHKHMPSEETQADPVKV